MPDKFILRDTKTEKVAAGLKRVELPVCEHDKINNYERITWEIDTVTASGNTRCRLVKTGGAYDIPIAEQDVPSANTLYYYSSPVRIHPGERVCLEIDQAQADTTAKLYALGYWNYQKDGILT